MVEGLKAMEKNNTWRLKKLPSNKRDIDLKWVFKMKLKLEIAKHNSRLVIRGFMQKADLDYDEVYLFLARLETMRLIIVEPYFAGGIHLIRTSTLDDDN